MKNAFRDPSSVSSFATETVFLLSFVVFLSPTAFLPSAISFLPTPTFSHHFCCAFMTESITALSDFIDHLRFLEARGVDPDTLEAVEDDGTNEAVDELLDSVLVSLSLSGWSSSCCSPGSSVVTGALDVSITTGGFVAGLLPKMASIASK